MRRVGGPSRSESCCRIGTAHHRSVCQLIGSGGWVNREKRGYTKPEREAEGWRHERKRRRVTCRPLRSPQRLCSLSALVPRFDLERRIKFQWLVGSRYYSTGYHKVLLVSHRRWKVVNHPDEDPSFGWLIRPKLSTVNRELKSNVRATEASRLPRNQ